MRRPMKGNSTICRVWLILVLLLTVAIFPGEAAAEVDGYGPFPVRNFQPIQLMILGMFGDRATVLSKGRLDIRLELAETSTVFRDDESRVSTTMKLETLRSAVFLRYGLTDQLEVGMEVPALYRYRGFLEGGITATERATTGLAPARDRLLNTGFAFNMTRDGQPLFSGGESSLGLGDITLISKYQLQARSEDRPAVAVRLALKLPTGDSARFFGSGHPDVGAGLAVEQAVGARWILYGNLNGIFPTGDVAGLTLHPAWSALAAVEYLWSSTLSLVAQFDYYSSPFQNTGTKILDRGVTEGVFGFSYQIRKHLLWQVYGVENLDFIEGSAADFTLSTLVTFRFGP